MFAGNALAFSRIAREKNCDGVQRRTGKTANPLIGTIPARVAKHFRACRHALPEFFRESCERLLVHAERAKSLPSEGNGYPSLLSFDEFPGLLSRNNLSKIPATRLVPGQAREMTGIHIDP